MRQRLMMDPSTVEPDVTPLSFAQERFWYLDHLDDEPAVYTRTLALELRGSLRPADVRAALLETVARHDALQTAITEREGRPFGVRAPEPDVPAVDLRGLQPGDAARVAQQLAMADAHRAVVLSTSPVRCTVMCVDALRFVALLSVHHASFDGWSATIATGELSERCWSLLAGRPPGLPTLSLRYTEFAVAQRSAIESSRGRELLSFWRERLRAVPNIELPVDRRSATRSPRGDSHTRVLASADVTAAGEAARAADVTPFVFHLATFCALLHRYSGVLDLPVGTAVAGRGTTALENVIGCFVNTVVVRIDLGGASTFADVLQRTRLTVAAALQHDDMPFERLVSALQPQRGAGRHPFFRAFFAYRNLPKQMAPPGCPVTVKLFDAPPAALAKFDIAFTVEPEEDGSARLVVEYPKDLFDATTIDRLAEQYSTLFAGAASRPRDRLGALPLLSPAERHFLCFELGRGAPLQAETMLGRLERTTAEVPDRIALAHGETHLTYAFLEDASARIAAGLSARGTGPGTLVGVCVERDPVLVPLLVAILRAGAGYVPLDPTHPQERLAFAMRDAELAVVVASKPEQFGAAGLPVHALWHESRVHTPDDDDARLAYVIYTSGSTGRPKGVVVRRRGLPSLIAWAEDTFGDGALARVLFSTSISFDVSVFELFVPLCVGGTVEMVRDVRSLTHEAVVASVSLISTVPSAASALLDARALDGFRGTLCLAGEAVPDSLARALGRLHGVRLVNAYGPTEDTVYSTSAEIVPEEGVVIGRPLPATRSDVVDPDGETIPRGAVGELLLAGEGNCAGYLNRPALTGSRFVPRGAGASAYRTGDLVRIDARGSLEFHARSDHQVKLRGFRIELGEIEAVLLNVPGVLNAVAIVRGDREKRLLAYIAPETVDEAALGSALRASLPAFMIPQEVVRLAALPMTANGKIDRGALPDPIPVATKPLAARDVREQQLMDIWTEVLGCPVSVGDDLITQHGVDSLVAVRVSALVRARLRVALHPEAFFQQSTIEHQAALLRGRDAEERRILVSLRVTGEGPPLFLVHPGGGTVWPYLPLARRLACPVYGVQDPHLLDDVQGGYESIEAMAAAYASALQESHPGGGYRLAGWSLGGLVAFEMARQLARRGSPVEFLALLDTYPPRVRIPRPRPLLRSVRTELTRLLLRLPAPIAGPAVFGARRWRRWSNLDRLFALGVFDERIRVHAIRALFPSFRAGSGNKDELWKNLFEHLRTVEPHRFVPGVTSANGLQRMMTNVRHAALERAYRGPSDWKFPGRVSIIGSSANRRLSSWSAFFERPPTVVPLDVSHRTMLGEQTIDRVADALRREIDSVQTGSPQARGQE